MLLGSVLGNRSMADIFKVIIIVVIVIILMVFIESYREFQSFRIRRYTINDINIPKSFDGYRIAVLGDLHNSSYGEDNQKLFEALDQLAPDAVCIAGDMVLCRQRAYAANIKTADFITRLCGSFDVYYGIGNHEKGLMDGYDNVGDNWDRYLERLPKDIKLLSNKHIELKKENDNIYIYGLDIERSFYKRIKDIPMGVDYLEEKLGKKKEGYSILLAHNPDYFDDYVSWGANLVISGHIHGGIVKLPFLGGVISPKLRIFPKYDYGLFKKDDKYMIITGGLGAHFPKIRVNNKPELLEITLKTGENI